MRAGPTRPAQATARPTATPETGPTWTPSPSGTRIRDLQGAAHRSPLEGERVEKVPGIVTAVTGNGFWMQDPYPDGDHATSEGVFVFTQSAPQVEVGDEVHVNGQVTEYRPGEAAGNLQFLPRLMKLGLTALSVSPRFIQDLRLAAEESE